MKPLDTIVPGLIQWRSSDPVTPLERPPKPERTQAPVDAPELLRSALDAIPNAGPDELDYDDWRNVVFALHSATDGDDSGLQLAHEFSSRSSKYDATFLDDRVWPYVRDRDDGITVRTLYGVAARYGWVDPTLIDDFTELPPDPMALNKSSTDSHTNADGSDAAPQGTGGTRFTIEHAHDFIAVEPKADIIKGVLPDAGLVVLFGESTAGKSFLALDMVASIARGEPWRGLKTQRRRALYICAEGAGGFRKRLKAYMVTHALTELQVMVLPDAPNFMETDDVRALLIEALARGPFGIVVVDTFARVIPGANENSAEDVGRAIKHCDVLHRKLGALVILIHHSGKDTTKGARGSSALRAAADGELEVVRFEQDRSVSITKLKDGEDGIELGFRLATVPVGLDADGDVITSCVVEHTTKTAKDKARNEPKGAVEKLVRGVVLDLLTVGDSTVPVATIIDAAVDRLPHDEGKKDQRRYRVSRALESLIEARSLTCSGGMVGVASDG